MVKKPPDKPPFPWLLAALVGLLTALLFGTGAFVIATIIMRTITYLQG